VTTRLFDAGEVTLGLRLFPLLPEDLFAPGPAPLARGGALVADVRLDNRHALGAQLGLDGRELSVLSDTHMLARGWDCWGEGVLDRIVGDFAVVAWEAAERRLILARDPFGQRPLHYHHSAQLFAAASMPVGLLALPDLPLALEASRLTQFLALTAETGASSFFAGIERVEPGALVRLAHGGLSHRKWYVLPRRPIRLRTPQAYVEALRAHLDDAVEARLRGAEARVGAHLSSGWDSSAVTVTAARLARRHGGRVTAFTAAPREGYDGPPPAHRHGDESRLAAIVAAGEPNIDHVIVRPGPRSPLDGLDRLSALLGRPVLNPCNQIWFDEICRRADSMGVRVMLTGDFGNESLTQKGADWLADLATQGRWGAWLWTAFQAMASGNMRPGGVIATTWGSSREGAFWRWLRRRRGEWEAPPGAHTALHPTLRGDLDDASLGADGFEQRLNAATVLDNGPFNKAMLAAFGVDHRFPLMDTRLVEFCLNIPPAQVFRGGRSRDLARRALADRLPAAVLNQKTAGYQGIDWHEGLTAARADVEIELDRLEQTPLAMSLLDLPRMRRLVEDWPEGGWSDARVFIEYRLALQRGLSVGRFIRTTLRSNA
jgi:asparagine synthase (glutamine-hydrolysing)